MSAATAVLKDDHKTVIVRTVPKTAMRHAMKPARISSRTRALKVSHGTITMKPAHPAKHASLANHGRNQAEAIAADANELTAVTSHAAMRVLKAAVMRVTSALTAMLSSRTWHWRIEPLWPQP